jgi:putative membrane protein
VHEVWGTVGGRWYVTLFGVVFVVFAWRQLGWRKLLVYVVVALAVGALAENGSVHFGFPYTRYSFNSALRGKELWICDVPLFVPLSYGFMAYFAFAAGRMLASGPRHTRARKAWHEWLMALVLAVWAVWVLDPIVRLGKGFYLGEVFHYHGPGFWFGLPTGSQAGFALTAGILLAVLFWFARDDPDHFIANPWRHPNLIPLVTYHGEIVIVAIAGWWIGANTIASAAVLLWVPVAAMTAVHWSALRSGDADVQRRAGALREHERQDAEAVHERRVEGDGVPSKLHGVEAAR